MKRNLSVFILSALVLPGCGLLFQEDPNRLTVEPIKIVPCTSEKHACGGLRVAPDQADGFVVTVSYERFRAIVHECLGRECEEEQIRRLGVFAVQQVTALGYCKSAEISVGNRRILAWEGMGVRGIYVVCTS